MRPKPKPVYLVEQPPTHPVGKVDLTPTADEAVWIRVFWRWFGWGGLAIWATLGFIFNAVTRHANGGGVFLAIVGLGGLAVLLTLVMAWIGAEQAERAEQAARATRETPGSN